MSRVLGPVILDYKLAARLDWNCLSYFIVHSLPPTHQRYSPPRMALPAARRPPSTVHHSPSTVHRPPARPQPAVRWLRVADSGNVDHRSGPVQHHMEPL